MKIGVFDSGIGGLIILKAIVKKLPQYDYHYLGDTQRVPYGNRSKETVFEYTKECIEYLFKKDCQLIIIACNTASVDALRRLQREYLPKHYPDRRILGVIIPTVEIVASQPHAKVGLIATIGTCSSKIYEKELKKLNPKIKIYSQPSPLLVPLVEHNELKFAPEILKSYIDPLIKKGIASLILGCAHYPILKNAIQKIYPKLKIISQTDIIPKKLADYLTRHPEIERKLSKKKKVVLETTDITPTTTRLALRWFGNKSKLKKTKIDFS